MLSKKEQKRILRNHEYSKRKDRVSIKQDFWKDPYKPRTVNYSGKEKIVKMATGKNEIILTRNEEQTGWYSASIAMLDDCLEWNNLIKIVSGNGSDTCRPHLKYEDQNVSRHVRFGSEDWI